jgi:CO/xanthine dehydrogenase Mo-binding subunit
VTGLGEPPAIPGAGAIANAIYNAIGVRIHDLPITPDKILKALAEKE